MMGDEMDGRKGCVSLREGERKEETQEPKFLWQLGESKNPNSCQTLTLTLTLRGKKPPF